MTVERRLEALEEGQGKILTIIGDMKLEQGRISGMLSEWISERRNSIDSYEKVFAAFLRECEARRENVEKEMIYINTQLNTQQETINSHEKRISKVEKHFMIRTANWSTTKAVVIFISTLAGVILSCIAIVEAINHMIGN
jgi:chromosome segregation ATPase